MQLGQSAISLGIVLLLTQVSETTCIMEKSVEYISNIKRQKQVVLAILTPESLNGN